MKKYIGIAVLLLSFTAGAQARSFLGPQGEFSSLFSSLEWEPGSGCSKPYRAYGMTEYEAEAYISSGKRYLGCIKRQADNDAEYAVEAVYDGYNKAADDFLAEVRRGY